MSRYDGTSLGTLILGVTLPQCVGLAVKVVLLLSLGALVAHSREQLQTGWDTLIFGISVPALITTAIAGGDKNQTVRFR